MRLPNPVGWDREGGGSCRRVWGRLACAIALLALCAAALPASTVAAADCPKGVGVVGSVTTVRPADCPSGGPSAELTAAKNEFESFQVVVQAGSGDLDDVSVRASDLVGPAGRIDSTNLTVYREAYYDVRATSDLEGKRGFWPDALIPEVDPYYRQERNAFPVDVPAGKNRVVWVDVFVPPDAAAGHYTGTVSLSGGLSATIEVRLRVLDFGLPSTTTMASAFGMTDTCEAFYAQCPDESTRWALNALFLRAGLDNRVGIAQLGWPYDPRQFKAHALPFIEGTATDTRLRGARLTSLEVWAGCLDQPGCIDAWRDTARAHHFGHLVSFRPCDEPGRKVPSEGNDYGDWNDCKRNAKEVHRPGNWPGVRLNVTASIQEARWAEKNTNFTNATEALDTLVPIIQHMDDKPGGIYEAGNQRPKYNPWLVSDPRKRLWLYLSCLSDSCGGADPAQDSSKSHPYWAGWPSYVIDQPATEHRAMGWMVHNYRASGELYWDTTYKLEGAWRDQYDFGGNGDGTLFYPGKACVGAPPCVGGSEHIPIESIRLKRIRDGREDHEWLRFLVKQGKADEADAVVKELFGPRDVAMYNADVSQEALDSARGRLARLIRQSSNP